MNEINKIRNFGLLVFVLPFLAVNLCLILSQIFPFNLDGNYFLGYKIYHAGDGTGAAGRPWLIPYFDGSFSISRVVRVFPNYIIFKPAMFLTVFFIVKYWVSNKKLFIALNYDKKIIKKFFYFGIFSAICLFLHTVFLGIKIDNDIYKFSRRFVLLSFIIFEIIAQAYLVYSLIKIKEKLKFHINKKILTIKKYLVSLLIFVAVIL